MRGAITPLPNTPSWHGSELKQGTALPFIFTLLLHGAEPFLKT
jgi:hypothetical protein